MNYKATLALSLLASLVLAACGGGGGGDSSSAAPASSSASTPSAASTPAASTPAAASAPAAASSPALSGEPLPSLTSPQAGSAATSGNGIEGLWTSTFGADKTSAFIDPQGNISALNSVGTFVLSEMFGVVATTAPNWTLTSGLQYNGGVYYTTTSGSGTFAAKQTFTGSYVYNGNTVSLAWNYDAANALAVTQSSVAGTWTQTGSSLTIANDGTLSGTMSNCPVSGTLLLTTPSSSKNLFTLTVTGTSASCALAAGTTYTGNAAIAFLPITGSTLYSRSIIYLIKSANNATVAYGQVKKQ
ncbi:hypothetical protein [Paraburkholderia ginsengiterrae]